MQHFSQIAPRFLHFSAFNSIGNQLYNTMVVFKMCDSVPSVRYSSICNVLSNGDVIVTTVDREIFVVKIFSWLL